MRLIMTHGYMLSGTGSSVYAQNLCRGLAREGHEVHLLCQERGALSYDFVAACCVVDGERIKRRRCEEVARRNCMEHLGWGTLAQRLVALAEDSG